MALDCDIIIYWVIHKHCILLTRKARQPLVAVHFNHVVILVIFPRLSLYFGPIMTRAYMLMLVIILCEWYTYMFCIQVFASDCPSESLSSAAMTEKSPFLHYINSWLKRSDFKSKMLHNCRLLTVWFITTLKVFSISGEEHHTPLCHSQWTPLCHSQWKICSKWQNWHWNVLNLMNTLCCSWYFMNQVCMSCFLEDVDV